MKLSKHCVCVVAEVKESDYFVDVCECSYECVVVDFFLIVVACIVVACFVAQLVDGWLDVVLCVVEWVVVVE